MEHTLPVISMDLIRKQEMDTLLARATPERRAIFESLKEKKWFENTDPELQKKLLSLPSKGRENHDGFLQNLAERPEEISNIKVERMIDLPHGSFALVPKFEVSRVDNPAIRYTYEYVSWRTGPLSGAKGVVFVEKEGKTTHFIALRGEKFAPGKKVWDTIGGFIDLESDGVKTIDDRTTHEIQEELGIKDLKLSRVVNLGRVAPDSGLTNNEPAIFAAFIKDTDMQKLSSAPVNPDVYELKSGAVILPMEQLPKIVMENNDGYFLSTIARSWAQGIIAPPAGMEGRKVGFSAN